MRLWSLHPRYFDRQALTAAWREALLAQAVLVQPGRGYSNHPQLQRFREHPTQMEAIGAFLCGIADEADARGYHFDRSRIRVPSAVVIVIPVTDGQLAYEWAHLTKKLEQRSPIIARRWSGLLSAEAHPLFTVVPGPVASWEKTSSALVQSSTPGQNDEQRKVHREQEEDKEV